MFGMVDSKGRYFFKVDETNKSDFEEKEEPPIDDVTLKKRVVPKKSAEFENLAHKD